MVRYSLLAIVLVAGCRSHSDAAASAASADTTAAVATTAAPAIPPDDIWHKDPCRYVSQAEAETYLGPLLHTPYRAATDHISADSNGHVCLYRAKDGHSLEVSADWMDGKTTMKQYTQGFLSKFFVDDKGKTDTLSDAWDQAAIRDGTLFALKGDTLLHIDYAASTAGLTGAAKLAEDAIGRLGKPLAYNGVADMRGVPGPLVAPRDPCSVLTRAQVEKVMGPLTADPHSDAGSCTFPSTSGDLVLQVAWINGFRALFSARAAATNASAMNNQQFGLNMDKAFAAMNQSKQLRKIVGKDATLPTGRDTTVAGPWADSRLGGVEQTTEVVKKDVYMELPLIRKPGAAVALLTSAMNTIQ